MASCSARMIIRHIWLGNDVTQALLRNKVDSGGNDDKHHPETTQNVPFPLSDSAGLLVMHGRVSGTQMSKYLKTEQRSTIPKHRHCVVCATPISYDKEFCGPNCEDRFKRAERKKKYTFILILLMFPVLFLVLTMFRPG